MPVDVDAKLRRERRIVASPVVAGVLAEPQLDDRLPVREAAPFALPRRDERERVLGGPWTARAVRKVPEDELDPVAVGTVVRDRFDDRVRQLSVRLGDTRRFR
jgi:hypothetical protein